MRRAIEKQMEKETREVCAIVRKKFIERFGVEFEGATSFDGITAVLEGSDWDYPLYFLSPAGLFVSSRDEKAVADVFRLAESVYE